MESAWVEVNGGKNSLVEGKISLSDYMGPKCELDVVSQNFGRSKI